MKKLISLFTIGMVSSAHLLACPVCERNQPKLLRGIVHGQGPESQSDYVIISIVAGIVLLSVYLSIKALVRPGEHNKRHIKRTVLEE